MPARRGPGSPFADAGAEPGRGTLIDQLAAYLGRTVRQSS
jgi:hypothetical protein